MKRCAGFWLAAGLLTMVTVGAGAQAAQFVSLAAGTHHTCALDAAGNAWCWGANDLGQLGRGTDDGVAHPEPAPVKSDSSFMYLSARFEHTCALNRVGTVRCWGAVVGPYLLANQNTSLLYGMETWSVCKTGFKCNPMPTATRGRKHYTKLAVGFGHVCGIEKTGSISCWGWNRKGQAGPVYGEGLESPKFPIDLTPTYVAVAAGSDHSCALDDQGGVQCWGSNHSGQLGPSSSAKDRESRPVLLPGRATALVAGDAFTCALANGVDVYCWGMTSGDSMTAARPLQVRGAFLSLTAGGRHACALAVGGAVYCWGANEHGQAGDSTGQARVDQPLRVMLPGRAKTLAAGSAHTCALLEDGSAYCWGEGLSGQLGGSIIESTAKPVRVGAQTPAGGTS